ncbi:MAG: acyl carrier protein, partial [Kangiellaceae bacterium]|nr:acyl carrier protein [Kangiellaceae bacterium]
EVIPRLKDHQFKHDDALKDLGANSIDRSEIVMMTLESLSLNIPLITIAKAENLGELASILHEKL